MNENYAKPVAPLNHLVTEAVAIAKALAVRIAELERTSQDMDIDLQVDRDLSTGGCRNCFSQGGALRRSSAHPGKVCVRHMLNHFLLAHFHCFAPHGPPFLRRSAAKANAAFLLATSCVE